MTEALTLFPSDVNGWFCPDDPGEPVLGKPRLSVNEKEGRLLSWLAYNRDVLEIGTGLGVSTKYLAATAYHVDTIDIDAWVQEFVFPNLPRNVNAYGQRMGLTSSIAYDMAFIDGLHTKEAVLDDLGFCLARVEKGGLIVLHDLYIPGIRGALMELDLAFIHVQSTAGMALVWQ